MSVSTRKALLIFMKLPEAGRVKTRLASVIGQEKALSLYQKLVRRTLGIASDFKMAHGNVDLFLFHYPPESKVELRKAYPGPWKFSPQMGRHLGEKMRFAFELSFRRGYGQVVLIGSDIADLKVIDIENAFQALAKSQAAVGPAQDGGFYLIGLKAAFDKIFDFDSWSTSSVYERTLNCFYSSNVKVVTLSKRRDIDVEEDLTSLKDQPVLQDQISTVIPFIGSLKYMAPLIDSLEAQLWPGDEIIIVKGDAIHGWGTEDITSDTRLVFAPRGRGIQMNRGFKVSKGNLLWFLHADSVTPPNFGYHIRKLSLDPEIALGCFEHSFMSMRALLKLVSKWANLRTKYFKLPYGDQGFFCPRHVFERVGGFKKEFLMEDVDFVRACKKLGKILIISQPLYSSPNRYLKRGIFRASCLNHLLMLLYFLGVSDRRLYTLYYRGD